ncbi:LOW QUALITY PROTEIN: F-BAR and double SH3 domains protein 2-like [Dermacentor silvarum]|uniref:LOW QUALITY PROTEIN: F-BAR and double SH3 domains protein 2-like n=1 Tax=Dermacentor silvarum TaxID=543639 RepID=UPI00210161AD|nr:LOW QUALITY PROTEIN: F-BAR and double SH3 domains protein 2-like [Dermacentor silvarum]
MQPPPRKVKAHTQLKNIHNEQITKLQTKHQQDVELLEDLRNFTKIRATVEKEYGNALLKLATTYLQKKPPPGIEIKSEDSQDKKTVFGVWRMLLDETEKIAKARLAAAEVFSQQISENAKNVRANKLQVAKKCFDNLRRIQDEVQQCVQEVDKTKKLYFEEEHMAHEARDKAHDAEEKLKKKKGRIFQSITSLQKNSQKFSSRREACDIQSTKARNDYILALVAANAHQSRFYETDLPDTLQSLDCDVSEKVKDYIQLMSRTELLTVAACNSSFSRILEDASHITRQYTVECFLQDNQVLGKPIKYDFDPCDNDQVRTICTEHHADICLGKEAKKWASAYMKECRTLRDANKELNRLLGQIAKGEKTMEASTGEQEDVEQKLEDIRNSIRKAETSKLKAEARLEALREGGVNVDEFLNSLDIDALQIEDLSRKGSTASRGSRKSSRSDLNYEEPNEAAYYEGDFDGGSSSDTSGATAAPSVAGAPEADEAAQVMAASSAQGSLPYEHDPTSVNWDDEPQVSVSTIDVGSLRGRQRTAGRRGRRRGLASASGRGARGSLQVAIKCFALFSYEAANPDELSFVEQEEMEIVSEGDGDGWIKARNYKGEEGYIPQNYVEIAENQPAGASGESFSSVDYRVETSDDVDGDTAAAAIGADPECDQEPPTSEPPAAEAAEPVVPPADFPNTLAPPGEVHLSTTYCRAIYDYEPTCDDELGFAEGQVIRILRTVVHDGVDDGWWEGELDGRTGIFPSLMVEALKVTGEPQTPMEDPSMDTVPPPPAFTPPKPSFLVPPAQVILTQPTPDHEQSGEADQPTEPAVSVLYNDPDFQLELPTPQQAHYQSQFSGSESESSDHDVAGLAEAATYAPLVSSPESPAAVDTSVAEEPAKGGKPPRPPTPPHQQTVTVVIDSPDEPPREFADSEDEDNGDQASVVEAPVEVCASEEQPTKDEKLAEVEDAVSSEIPAADAGETKVMAAGETQDTSGDKPDEVTVAASAVSEGASGDQAEPPEELSKEDQANNNATD